MNWFFLAVAAAVIQATNDVLSKKKLQQISVQAMSWGPFTVSFVILTPICLIQGVPETTSAFLPNLVLVSLLDVVGVMLYFKAIKSSDLSLALPIQMFTPLFLIVTSPLMLGEYPSLGGCAGVLLIVAGAYVLNMSRSKGGFFGPFVAIIHEPGPRYMFLGAITWSITWNLHKAATVASSPTFYVCAHQFLVSLFMGSYLLLRNRQVFAEVRRHIKFLTLIGFLVTLMFLCQMTAVQSGLTVYVAAIKRTSVLMGVALGILIFKEMGFRERLTGAGIMIAGVFITAL